MLVKPLSVTFFLRKRLDSVLFNKQVPQYEKLGAICNLMFFELLSARGAI
jgi:hypothetical protein